MGLAEVKNKQKWSLNPRGNLWANDTQKFGLKLMEKMGYEQGQGLGAKKSGALLPIAVRQKSDNKGIGFDGHDDTWLAHQDDFSAVLASLNVEHGSTEQIKEDGKKSLERLSKKSRKRVHYQRFTRGKDLANYSKDDLGCILGTKSEKFQEKQKEREKGEEKSNEEEEEVGSEEKSHGLVTIKGGNYQDYFEKKMAALKEKGLYKYTGDMDLTGDNGGYDPVKLFKSSVNDDQQETTNDRENFQHFNQEKRKKKKSKKEKDNSEEIPTIEDTTEDAPKKKKKKSKQREEIEQPEQPEQELKVEKKKKKKDKKEKKDSSGEEPAHVEEVKTKKSKKNKKKRKQLEELSEAVDEEPPKKRKKCKTT